eukprot:jgi/Chrzof1/66/Cz01g02110.t1
MTSHLYFSDTGDVIPDVIPENAPNVGVQGLGLGREGPINNPNPIGDPMQVDNGGNGAVHGGAGGEANPPDPIANPNANVAVGVNGNGESTMSNGTTLESRLEEIKALLLKGTSAGRPGAFASVHQSDLMHGPMNASMPNVACVNTDPREGANGAGGQIVRFDIHKVVNKPPVFKGSAECPPIRRWLNTIANYLTETEVPNMRGVGVAASYLRGDAEQHWFNTKPALIMQGKGVTSWHVFKHSMLLAYGHFNPGYTARAELVTVTQGNMPAAMYARKLMSLWNIIAEAEGSEIPEADKGTHSDLYIDTGFEGSKRGPKKDFLEGKRLKNRKRRSLSAPPAVSPKKASLKPRGGVRKTGGLTAKKQSSNPKRSPEYKKRFKDGTCLHCGEKGHFIAKCPHKEDKPAA